MSMATAAEAARDFATGPHVLEAARLLLSRFSLTQLCEALANARPEDTDDLCRALERLSEFEETRALFLGNEATQFLCQGAAAPAPRIRGMVAGLLVRLVQAGGDAGAAAVARLVETGVLEACESLLLVEETGTAEDAARVIKRAAQHSSGSELALGVAERLRGRIDLDDTQRVRVLHLFVELGRDSDEVFRALEAKGAFKEVLGAFLTQDLLLKLNAVELMEALGSYQAGQELLSGEDTPSQLAQDLADPVCDSSVRMCVTRLLGFVLLRRPDPNCQLLLASVQAPFPQAVAMQIESRDPAEKLCALRAWANASCCEGGLSFFLKWSPLAQAVLACASAAQNEVCMGAMDCWGEVLNHWPRDAAAEPGRPAANLWELAETKLLPTVLKNLGAKPFPEVRQRSWYLLTLLVSKSRAAAQAALPSKEMRDIMLDFSSETKADPRIAKHEFCKALVKHQGDLVRSFLSEAVQTVLEEYARQGPHWAPAHHAQVTVGQGAGA